MASAAPPPATATAAAMRLSTASITCVAVVEGGIDAFAQRARVLTGLYGATPALVLQRLGLSRRAGLFLLASVLHHARSTSSVAPQKLAIAIDCADSLQLVRSPIDVGALIGPQIASDSPEK